jgi:hypothetical protein
MIMMAECKSIGIGGGTVIESQPGRWCLEIPSGEKKDYRLAQLDDYLSLSRRNLLWHPPLCLNLEARSSAQNLSGTWGFGLWNDPFSANLGLGGMARRLPALPDTAWFFYASPPNYLALKDDHPAQGMLAATFSAPRLPFWLLALGLPLVPLLAVPLFAKYLRRLARVVVKESARNLYLDLTLWHSYKLEWLPEEVHFFVDEMDVFNTPISPVGPLGLVLWIDNQYAAFNPNGRFKTGTLETPETAWLEIKNITVNTLRF